MTSHLVVLMLFALLVSVVFAALSRDDVRGQLQFGARMFLGFVGAALALGWLIYPLPL